MTNMYKFKKEKENVIIEFKIELTSDTSDQNVRHDVCSNHSLSSA